MKEILKRLELIKTAISIDDEEIIELQVVKLKKLKVNDEVKAILAKLENLDFGEAVVSIEMYLKQYSGVVEYVGTEVQGLKLELKTLEKKLQRLSEKRVEYLNDIDDFSTMYNIKLGAIIQSILKLKEQILLKSLLEKEKKLQEDTAVLEDTKKIIDEFKSAINELKESLELIDENNENFEELNNSYKELQDELKRLEEELKEQKENLKKEIPPKDEYEEAKRDYEEFSGEYEDIKQKDEDRFELNEDEKKELKKLYRVASRLCHPDIVVDELKEQAHEIMQALNEAYSNKDLKTVQKILTNLESGIAFDIASDKIDDKKILKAKIAEFRAKITDIEVVISKIKEDETFVILSDIDNIDEYFEEMKKALEEEKQTLKASFSVTDDVKTHKQVKQETIKQENNNYAKHIKAIEQPTFEKIRRHCSNLVDEDKADALHVELAKNAKMYKALIYDAMEQFLEDLEDESLTLVDWGCSQGLASALVLDYINEKELDIEIKKVILIDKDEKKLSRAMLHVDVLKEDEFTIEALHVEDKTLSKELDIDNSTITLNLIVSIWKSLFCVFVKCR